MSQNNAKPDDDCVLWFCQGPPLCLLPDDQALLMQNCGDGCELCTKVVVHSDGSKTVTAPSVH